jgi:hypothetical protein
MNPYDTAWLKPGMHLGIGTLSKTTCARPSRAARSSLSLKPFGDTSDFVQNFVDGQEKARRDFRPAHQQKRRNSTGCDVELGRSLERARGGPPAPMKLPIT